MAHTAEVYHEIAAKELAAWLRAQGEPIWWTIDGDPVTAGEVSFPCPSDELAGEFERLKRPLLVRDPSGKGPGRTLAPGGLDGLLSKDDSGNRVAQLRWKDQGAADPDWLLIEDTEAAGLSKAATEAKRG
jgi:hypothetical protein